MIKLFFKYNKGVILERVPLSADTVGLDCSFEFSDEWNGLTKTAVFEGSGVTKDVILLESTVDVPPEVLAEAGGELRIGVYGMDGDGNIVIPTMYVTAGAILESADPDKDPSTDGSLEVWAQTLNIALDARKKAVAAEAAAIGEKESAEAYAKSSEDSAKASELSKSEAEDAEANAKNYSDAASEAADDALRHAEDASSFASDAERHVMGASLEAESAQNSALEAKGYADNAESSANYSESCAQEAENAKNSIENMTVTSEALGEGEGSMVTKTVNNGVVNLHFGLPEGKKGKDGVSGLPTIYERDYSDEFIMLEPYSETRITVPATEVGVIAFMMNQDAPGVDQWSLVFTVGDETPTVAFPVEADIRWAVAEPTFTAGYTYYLSFIPLNYDVSYDKVAFEGTLLGVWVAKELS